VIQERALLKAIKESGVTKVVVIDDAFDAPAIETPNAGALLQYLEEDAFAPILEEVGITQDQIGAAKAAIAESNYGDDPLNHVVSSLYDKFVLTLDDRYNPGGMFGQQASNIIYVRPLLALLEKCEPKLVVRRIGSEPDEVDAVDRDTHLIFVDFYLDRAITANADVGAKHAAKQKSLESVRRLLQAQGSDAASVVLMSWQDVKSEANKFREDIKQDNNKSSVFASRFAFISKHGLELKGGDVEIDDNAGDVLLDIFQSYEFGRATHVALEAWLECATAAVDDMRGEIERLTLRDFAYLVKFRLATEGQGLLEYLEWFFGECLLDRVGRLVDAKIKDDERLKGLGEKSASRIEGAFDGPTKKVAELYHRVRIENPRGIPRASYRLGDLYLVKSGDHEKIEAILTPDCDLIKRSNGTRNAPRILTVSGALKSFDAPKTSVSDFVQMEGRPPQNISWEKTDISSKEFGAWPAPNASSEDAKYIGTLRPLYAQELQRVVLNNLGRVGLTVAPALGMAAQAKVHVRDKDGKSAVVGLGNDAVANCYVIPGRNSSDKSVVLFRRHFVTALIEGLKNLDGATLAPAAAKNLENLRGADAGVKLATMVSGLSVEQEIEWGIFLTAKTAPKGSAETWCFIIIDMVVAN
jgi:hypothetical protein